MGWGTVPETCSWAWCPSLGSHVFFNIRALYCEIPNNIYGHSGITGRFIIPGVDGKYKPCSYCLSKEWSATHTTFECTRVHKTWQALWASEQANTRVKPRLICLKDILTVNGFKVKAKKPYVFRLSKLQVKILILMSELIKWTELHKNDQTLKLAIVDEKEFIEDMLRKINLQISYFKKIGIG